MKKICLFLSLTLLFQGLARGGSLEEEAWPLLQRFNAELVRYQDTLAVSPNLGGLYCPACGVFHSRAAEALWPLAFEAARTGDSLRMQQALALAGWLIRRQGKDGAWTESDGGWKGTTTDQLYALVLAYPLVRDHLDRRGRREWRKAMRHAATFLCRVMDNHYAYINYCATSAASLAEAGRLLGRRKYLRKAVRLARLCASKFNDDFILEGEGDNWQGSKQGVDIGYNLEMSLWGLARYAMLTGDREVWDLVRQSGRAHSWFIYPDGTLDASVGLRSSKWALWGSATSDGSAPLWALLSSDDPTLEGLACRNIQKIRSCISRSGLLAPGPEYDRIRDTLPCLYHTFTKAKSLATALAWAPEGNGSQVRRPGRDTLVHLPTLNTCIIRRGTFQGTVTAYGYKARRPRSKFMQRPSGGAMTLLWAEGYGLVQASSQTQYERWEESFPWMPPSPPLTPRIEITTTEGWFTNLYDFGATLSFTTDSICTITGQLKDSTGRTCGVQYQISYVFKADRLEKIYRIQGGYSHIIEPVLIDPETRVHFCDSHTARLRRGSLCLTLELEGKGSTLQLDTASDGLYQSIYPALRAVPIHIGPVRDTSLVRLTFSLE